MLHMMTVDSYGLHNPPTTVQVVEDESTSWDRERAAEEEFDFEAWARETTEQVNSLTAAAEHWDAEGLEGAITRLDELEAELRKTRRQLQRARATSKNLKARLLRTMTPGTRGSLLADATQVEHGLMKLLGPVESVLRCYRDARWQLMAIQAQREPEMEAPVFDNTESLLAYLQA